MTIDEAIIHAEEVAEEKEEQAWEAQLQEEYGMIKSCKECAEEHRQLAEWLRDYKRLKEQQSMPTIALPDIDIKVESYKKLLKHPVVMHIMDEEQEQLDFVQPHKRIPVRLSVSENPNNCDLISREAVCDYIAEFINHEYSTDAECEMVDLMIKGIQHMPSIKPQPCEDAVSRKALISHIENQSREWGEDYDAQQILGDIEDMPSVKPQEPKMGHWIMRHRKVNTINYRTGEDVLTDEIHTVKELIRYEVDEPYCSECGKRVGDTSGNYCCFCGARMEVEQNG